MKIHHTLGLLIVGFGLGAIAAPGLHAAAKPPAYLIGEVEVIDKAAFKEFVKKNTPVMKKAGARPMVRRGRIVELQGSKPKALAMFKFESMDKAMAWWNSDAHKKLVPLRDKAAKFRSYLVEGLLN